MQHPTDRDEKITALLPSVYRELRRIANANMARMPAGTTLQPTALVHEAWLRLGGSGKASWQSRAHFMAAAAEAMRHILIDRARQRSTMRHGGDRQRVDLEHIDIPIDTEDDEQVLAINAALDKLTIEHPQIAELVKLRCFVGLEVTEAARVLHIPRATAYRRWQFARTWLYQELRNR
jgi:RNA polymerase sigma factor (TIGR02999 family)